MEASDLILPFGTGSDVTESWRHSVVIVIDDVTSFHVTLNDENEEKKAKATKRKKRIIFFLENEKSRTQKIMKIGF